MRLRRLDLTRYGKFSGQVLDFGLMRPGEPDLHVVYGPNEAGKSTLFSAYLDLLFGIESRNTYNFLHAYSAMRVGATLELQGTAHTVARIKKAQHDLLDANDQPLGDGILQAALSGLSRESYRTMFSLDEDTLKKGGESILSSKGDFGQLLFAATAGLSDLSRQLAVAQENADSFHRTGGRTTHLAGLVQKLNELKKQRDAVNIKVSDYRHLADAHTTASAAYEASHDALLQTRVALLSAKARLETIPRLAERRRLQDELLPVSHLPEAPAEWRGLATSLREQEIVLEVSLANRDAELSRLRDERAAVSVNTDVLALSAELDTMDILRGRHVTAEIDLPKLRSQLAEARAATQAILRRLGQSPDMDPMRLFLPSALVGELTSLIESWPVVDHALAAAVTETEAAEAALVQAKALLATSGHATPMPDEAVARLDGILRRLGDGRIAARRSVAQGELERTSRLLDERIAALRPWHGETAELAAMEVPTPGQIQGWKSALESQLRAIEKRAAQVEERETEIIRLTAEATAIGQTVNLDIADSAGLTLVGRDEAWASHRATLDSATADVFQAAMKKHDDAVNVQLLHSSAIARLQQARQGLAIATAQANRERELRDVAKAAMQDLQKEIAAAVGRLSPLLSAQMCVERIEAWLALRAEALATVARHITARTDFQAEEAEITSLRNELLDALRPWHPDVDGQASLDSLREDADRLMRRQRSAKGFIDTISAREAALADRARQEKAARAHVEVRDKAWERACRSCWFGNMVSLPSPAATREILKDLSELEPSQRRSTDLADRISKMEQDQLRFQDTLAKMCSSAALEIGNAGPDALAQALSRRIQEAVNASQRQIDLDMQIHDREMRRRDILDQQTLHAKQRDEITAFFGVESLSEAIHALQQLETRKLLTAEITRQELHMCSALGKTKIDDVETELAGHDVAGLDAAGLTAEAEGLSALIATQDRQTLELYAEMTATGRALEAVGGDSRAAELDQQHSDVLMEIEEQARQYLRLRLGTLAADHALHAYRQSHRSSFLQIASEAFSTVTSGAYRGLSTQPGKDAETLIVQMSGGGSRLSSELSVGTKAQLYLALRVAGFNEFAKTRRPVPFIGDDILETFDETRTENAFRLFSDMARAGQVIYLTHHRHLCDIASRAVPGVVLHELSTDQSGN